MPLLARGLGVPISTLWPDADLIEIQFGAAGPAAAGESAPTPPRKLAKHTRVEPEEATRRIWAALNTWQGDLTRDQLAELTALTPDELLLADYRTIIQSINHGRAFNQEGVPPIRLVNARRQSKGPAPQEAALPTEVFGPPADATRRVELETRTRQLNAEFGAWSDAAARQAVRAIVTESYHIIDELFDDRHSLAEFLLSDDRLFDVIAAAFEQVRQQPARAREILRQQLTGFSFDSAEMAQGWRGQVPAPDRMDRLRQLRQQFARLTQWDLLNRFPGVSTIRVWRGIRGVDLDMDRKTQEVRRYLEATPGQTVPMPLRSCSLVPSYAIGWVGKEPGEDPVVVLDMPIETIRWASWLAGGIIGGYEPELVVEGQATFVDLYYLDAPADRARLLERYWAYTTAMRSVSALDARDVEALQQARGAEHLPWLTGTTAKAPGSAALDADRPGERAYLDRFIQTATVIPEADLRPALEKAAAIIRDRAPPLATPFDPAHVVVHAVPGALFGLPRFEGATRARDLIYLYARLETDGRLHVYCAQPFWQKVLVDEPMLFAELLDHEWAENVNGLTHSQAAARAWAFATEATQSISPFHLFVLSQYASDDDLGQLRALTVEHPNDPQGHFRAAAQNFLAAEQVLPRPFPSPIDAKGHPWNQRMFPDDPGTIFSFLDRHERQIDEFRDRILPLLVGRHRQDRTLRISVIGPATGEEMATLLAAIIQAFDRHAEWGPVEEWHVQMTGIEHDAEVLEEASWRLTGHSPFVTQPVMSRVRGPQYAQRVQELLAALNRHRIWVDRVWRLRQADASQPSVWEALDHPDLILADTVLGGLTESEARDISRVIATRWPEVFLVRAGKEALLQQLSTHQLDARRAGLLDEPFTIAVPAWAQAAWASHETSAAATPFQHLKDALGLDRLQIVQTRDDSASGLTVTTVALPAVPTSTDEALAHGVIDGLTILRHGLAPQADHWKLLAREGRVIAIVPVVKPGAAQAYYLDLSPYHVEVPQPGNPRALELWRAFAHQLHADQRAIARALAQESLPSTKLPGSERMPYVWAKMDLANGHVMTRELDPMWFVDDAAMARAAREHEIGDWSQVFAVHEGAAQIIFPRFPGVYSPAQDYYQRTDRQYYEAVAEEAQRRGAQGGRVRAWVPAVGTGLDWWVAAMMMQHAAWQAGKRLEVRWRISDVNALAVANAAVLARLAGIDVTTMLHDVGSGTLPAGADEQEDVIFCNSPAPSMDRPAVSPAQEDVSHGEAVRLDRLWDRDPGGRFLLGLMRIASQRLSPDGRVVLWTTIPEQDVQQLAQRHQLPLQVKELDEDYILPGDESDSTIGEPVYVHRLTRVQSQP